MKADTETKLLRIPRDEHCISRTHISSQAVKVLYRLREAGYRSCLVGGGVRDLLLGLRPKDFDIATNATPEEVKALFRNCRLIGRRFRLAHVHFGREIIEVATFRGEVEANERLESKSGQLLRDNEWGDIEQDAFRRDFTINALFYDIDDFSIIDYTGGYQDLKDGILRLIGKPETRYTEDPVRMLRAIRFSAKLGLKMDKDTASAIPGMARLLKDISPARLFDESLKLFLGGHAVTVCEGLIKHGLFDQLFPAAGRSLARVDWKNTLFYRALENTDQRVAEDKPVTPGFLYAALMWEPLQERVARLMAEDPEQPEYEAVYDASERLFSTLVKTVAVHRRFSLMAREIWLLQSRFSCRFGKRAWRLIAQPRFRAAYDFLLLRAEFDDSCKEDAEWWTATLALSEDELKKHLQIPGRQNAGNGRRRSRRNKPGREGQGG